MTETVLGKRLFLGYTPEGERVYVEVRVSQANQRDFHTVTHEPIDAFERLAISGEAYAGASGFRDSQLAGAGQCLEIAESVLAEGGRLARGAERADVALILSAWREWHLNDMTAACAHMTPGGSTVSERLEQTPPCPVTGYRYGQQWLVRPLPAGLVDELRAACQRLSD